MAIPSQGFKVCNSCNLEKPVTDYYHTSVKNKQKINSRYLAFECKACSIKRNNAYAKKMHPIVKGIRSLSAIKRRDAIKDIVFKHYGGWICACCGETEPLFLTLDHVDNNGAEFRRRITGMQSRGGGYRSYGWLLRNNFPPEHNLQILCAMCQFGKRMNKGICPHEARRNDYSQVEVGSSDPKRIKSQAD